MPHARGVAMTIGVGIPLPSWMTSIGPAVAVDTRLQDDLTESSYFEPRIRRSAEAM
jgi:hypothetical protein